MSCHLPINMSRHLTPCDLRARSYQMSKLSTWKLAQLGPPPPPPGPKIFIIFSSKNICFSKFWTIFCDFRLKYCNIWHLEAFNMHFSPRGRVRVFSPKFSETTNPPPPPLPNDKFLRKLLLLGRKLQEKYSVITSSDCVSYAHTSLNKQTGDIYSKGYAISPNPGDDKA